MPKRSAELPRARIEIFEPEPFVPLSAPTFTPLPSHWRKLLRADEHLDSLDSEIRRWLKVPPYRLIEEFDAQTSEHVIRLQITEQPPIAYEAVVGDCVHDMRAALDHLAYALAEVHTGTPLPARIARTSEFPIFGDRAPTPAELSKKIGGIDPAAQTVIEGLQPHLSADYASELLWLLHELDRYDKHRVLHVSFLSYARTAYGGTNLHIRKFWWPGHGPISDGAEIARYSFGPIDPNAKVEMNLGLGFNASFDRDGPGLGGLVVRLLRSIRDHIATEVIAPLAPFL